MLTTSEFKEKLFDILIAPGDPRPALKSLLRKASRSKPKPKAAAK